MPLKNPIGEKPNRFDRATHDDVNPHLVAGLAEREGVPIVAKTVPLDDITPDPTQPRRAIPAAIRRGAGPDATPAALLEDWRIVAMSAAGWNKLDPVPYIMGTTAPELESAKLPDITAGLLELYALSASILNQGLLNPITIAPHTNGTAGYIIETGERRFLAYTLLRTYANPDKYSRIPARVMDKFSRERQAAENTNRSGLNVIEMARQFALLIMAQNPATPYTPYHECLSDYHFYAQVADTDARHGTRQHLLNAMGVKSPSQLTQYRRLLKHLTADEWQTADNENQSLNYLTGIVDERADTNYKKIAPPQSVQNSEHFTSSAPTPPPPQTPPPTWKDTTIPADNPAPPPAPTGKHTRMGWAVGDTVHHPAYGDGEIIAITGPSTVALAMSDGYTLDAVRESDLQLRKQPEPDYYRPPTPPQPTPARIIPTDTPPPPEPEPAPVSGWVAALDAVWEIYQTAAPDEQNEIARQVRAMLDAMEI